MLESIKNLLGFKKPFKLTSEEKTAITRFINNPITMAMLPAVGLQGDESSYYLGTFNLETNGFPVCRIAETRGLNEIH